MYSTRSMWSWYGVGFEKCYLCVVALAINVEFSAALVRICILYGNISRWSEGNCVPLHGFTEYYQM